MNFENRKVIKHQNTTYRGGRCRIIRGNDSWVVMHRGRFVGASDTYVEAETVAHRETGRLDSVADAKTAEAAEQQFERNGEAASAARALGTHAIGFDENGDIETSEW